MPAGALAPRPATPAELEAWDRRMVHGPGGHVYQSRAWGRHCETRGWRTRFVMLDDERGAVVLVRPTPWIGGGSAYVTRGPIVDPSDDGAAIASRLTALAEHLGATGVDAIACDAEIPAATPGLGEALRGAGFHPIAEIQPSRHLVSLSVPPDADDAVMRGGLTKSTRQRVDRAERDGVVVRRHDSAGWDGDQPLFDRPDRPLDEALGDFATLLEGTGRRKGFTFGPRDAFLRWWQLAHADGLVVYLEARDDGALLGGLLLYRHGDRLSTVHSADAPGVRETHPGVMHLLRWRAIQLAIREGRSEMDLGGVDHAPDHREPGPGDEMAGLYEHKRSFGARWVELVGAQERVIRPWRYALGRVTGKAARTLAR
jgi:lipid II:glycine glycyltransferase (peptidoglycan interpeptide bridge formation enzyme)